MSAPPLLELSNITVMRGERVVLDRLSLTINAGEHLALLGPNGCGKSTLVKVISRELYPVYNPKTAVRLFGQETWNVFDLRPKLGIVQNDFHSAGYGVTARTIVLSGYFSGNNIWPHQIVTPEMEAHADRLLDQLQATHLAHRPFDDLSSGEARRVVIARALVHNPQALLFDEPSTSLDLFAQHELRETMRALARAGLAIILVTHHLGDIIPEIDRVIMMQNGRILADGPKRELLTPARLHTLFHVPVDLAERDGFFHAW